MQFISITEGMCNGTRLKITGLYNHNIKAKIITGERIGEVSIPRITLNTGDSSSFPFTLLRKQFSIVLAFAITINKSQGQSFNCLDIFIRQPLFSHGQLYFALSGCKNPNNIFMENLSENSLITQPHKKKNVKTHGPDHIYLMFLRSLIPNPWSI